MAGINTEVYDIFHPTPVSLNDLSAIAVSLDVWRCEVKKYRSSDDALKTFNPQSQNISSKTVLPDLPSVFYAAIDKYVTKFGFSMHHWLLSHHERVFRFQYNHQNDVLGLFDDFVCDYGGSIDYTRTAERMMRCDRFNVPLKFIIACTYFFEDDIRRLWPSVSSTMNSDNIDFNKSPQLYYWICCLKNELHKIPIADSDNCVEEVMLCESMTHNRPSVDYFWNRIPAENRRRKADDLYRSDVQSFARYLSPKLDDEYIYAFVYNSNGFEMMRTLCRIAWHDREFIYSIWMLIRNIIKESAFTKEIAVILKFETGENITRLGQNYYEDYKDDKDGCVRRNWFNFCCEIWNSAPEILKRSAVRRITSNKRLFTYTGVRRRGYSTPLDAKEYAFFSTFLSCATYKERKTFWTNCWRNCIVDTRCKDFEKIMNLCFENENEINKFKKNLMAGSDNLRYICKRFLREFRFDELNAFVSLSHPEIQAARNFKQQLLQSVFIDEDEERSSYSVGEMILESKGLNEFINDAYNNDADLARGFKNQLMSLPEVIEIIARSAVLLPVEEVVEFMDTFVPNEQTLLRIKTHMADFLKKPYLFTSMESVPSLNLLSWCLGNNQNVE